MYLGRNPAVGTQKMLDSIESQFNGVLTTFDLRYAGLPTYPTLSESLIVSLGGVLQEPGEAYYVSSDRIVFSEAPATGTECWILLYSQYGTSTSSTPSLALQATGEPMGFENRTHSTISFTNGTRTFSIGPNSAAGHSSYAVWTKGTKQTISATFSVQVGTATGLYYIYFDAFGALQSKTTYFTWDTETPVAYVYWNGSTSTAPFVADERHGVVLDWQTHEYLHRTRGAVIAEGFSISAYTTTGNGSADAHAQFDLGNGTFFDEDLEVAISHSASPTVGTFTQVLTGAAEIPVFYLSGSSGAWVRDAPTEYACKQSGTTLQYNLLTGSTWSTTPATNNRYVVSWVVATNDITAPVICILGQEQYTAIGAAEAVKFGNLTLTNFPIVEFRPLWKVIFQTSTGFTNTPNALIANVLDLRQLSETGEAGTVVSDHGLLSGLTDDDHAQYLHVSNTRTGVTAEFNTTGKITTTSNIGIGIINPSYNLQVGPGDFANIAGRAGVAISVDSEIFGTFGTGGDLVLRAQRPTDGGGGSVVLGGSARGDFRINSVLIRTADTDRVFVNSSGNVGVGTTNPTTILELRTASDTQLTLSSSNNTADGRLVFKAASGTEIAGIYMQQNGDTRFYTGGMSNERLVIKTGGNVGIGITDPAAKLDVLGNAIISRPGTTSVGDTIYALKVGMGAEASNVSGRQFGLRVEQGGARYTDQTAVYATHTDTIGNFAGNYRGVHGVTYFGTQAGGSTEAIFGETAVPSWNYQARHCGVRGIAAGGSTAFNATYGLGVNNGAFGGHFVAYGKADVVGVYADAYHLASPGAGTQAVPLMVGSNGTELMRVNGSGNVGIGTTNPSSKLHVYNGDLELTGGYNLTWGGTFSGGNPAIWGNASNKTIRFAPDGNTTGLVALLGVSSSYILGNVGIGTTNPSSKLHVVGLTTLGGILNNVVTISNDGTYTSGSGSGTRLNVTYGGSVVARISNTGTGVRDGWFSLFDEGTSTVNIAANASRGGHTYFNNGGSVGIGTSSPQDRLHVVTSGITASAPSLGWPVYNAETDTNARRILFETAGNGDVFTSGQGATIALVLGSYFDSRVVITPRGAGGSSPSDQGTGRGKDMLIKAGTSDNNNYLGGRLFLSGGSGYLNGSYNTNYGVVSIQPFGGNVGIGTTNPSQKLDVIGSIRAYSSTVGSRPYVYLSYDVAPVDGAAHGRITVFKSSQNSYSGRIHLQPQYYTGSTYDYLSDAFVVDASGNVGIGTANPGSRLHVFASNGDTAEIRLQSSDGRTYALGSTGSGYGSSNNFIIYDIAGSVERFRLTSSGNIGIGTTNPIAKLDTRGTLNVGGGSEGIWLGNVGDNSAYDNVKLYYTGYNSGSPRVYLTPRTQPGSGNINTFLHLQSNVVGGPGSNTMGLLVDGSVGIGTTSFTSKLSVNGETSLGQGRKLSFIGLDINSGETPNYIKIKTSIPFASGGADFTVNIKGFRYGGAQVANLSICWHFYNNSFYNPVIISSGSWAPTVVLSNESGLVCITLYSPGYWPKLYVESMYSSAYADLYSSGWTWVNEIPGGANNVTVLYKSDFGNSFVMNSNGNVGIGATNPPQKLYVNGNVQSTGKFIFGGSAEGGARSLAAGSGATVIDTGITINATNGGGTMLVLACRNTSNGTATQSAVYMLQFYYDGDNTPTKTLISGSDIMAINKSATNTLTVTCGTGNWAVTAFVCGFNIT